MLKPKYRPKLQLKRPTLLLIKLNRLAQPTKAWLKKLPRKSTPPLASRQHRKLQHKWMPRQQTLLKLKLPLQNKQPHRLVMWLKPKLLWWNKPPMLRLKSITRPKLWLKRLK
jgi:hypothetical protein